jgi:hypothetical protein
VIDPIFKSVIPTKLDGRKATVGRVEEPALGGRTGMWFAAAEKQVPRL